MVETNWTPVTIEGGPRAKSAAGKMVTIEMGPLGRCDKEVGRVLSSG